MLMDLRLPTMRPSLSSGFIWLLCSLLPDSASISSPDLLSLSPEGLRSYIFSSVRGSEQQTKDQCMMAGQVVFLFRQFSLSPWFDRLFLHSPSTIKCFFLCNGKKQTNIDFQKRVTLTSSWWVEGEKGSVMSVVPTSHLWVPPPGSKSQFAGV